MSRYQNPDDDMLEIIRRIARRVANLEKANPLNYGTIDEGGLIVKSGGSISVYNNLDELNTFIGEGRVDFADSGVITGTIGEFEGEYYDNNANTWIADTLRGISLYRLGQGFPFFFVAHALTNNKLEALFGYDGKVFEHFGVKSESIFFRGRAAQDSVIQMQDDGDIHIEAAPLHSVFLQGGSVDISVTSDFDVDADGGISLTSSTGDVSLDPQGSGELRFFIGTTTNPANLNESGTNQVRVVTSARKYKEDIQDAEIDPADVLKMRPRTWLDKNDLTQWENDQQVRAIAKSNGEEAFIEGPVIPYPDRTIGFVAEEIAALPSMHIFVNYKDGQPEGLHYDRMAAAFVSVAKENYARVDALETKVTEQQKEIDALKAQVVKVIAALPKGLGL